MDTESVVRKILNILRENGGDDCVARVNEEELGIRVVMSREQSTDDEIVDNLSAELLISLIRDEERKDEASMINERFPDLIQEDESVKVLSEMFPSYSKETLRQKCEEMTFEEILCQLSAKNAPDDEHDDSRLDLAIALSLDESFGETREAGEIEKLETLKVECSICFSEYSMDEMVTCQDSDDHLYCCECLQRYVKVEIGKANYTFTCLNDDCTSVYTHELLFNILDRNTFENMTKNKQHVEIQAAGIDNLESCPFCTFALEFDEKATITTRNPVLKCENPMCEKISCRLCKKEDHRPAKCDENDAQKDARTRLENEMTEAMIRTCYNCSKRFIIRDGCNKMTCDCGASMCYLCKQPVKDYSHFENGRCSLYTDPNVVHSREANERAEQVKRTLNPDLLLNDPTK